MRFVHTARSETRSRSSSQIGQRSIARSDRETPEMSSRVVQGRGAAQNRRGVRLGNVRRSSPRSGSGSDDARDRSGPRLTTSRRTLRWSRKAPSLSIAPSLPCAPCADRTESHRRADLARRPPVGQKWLRAIQVAMPTIIRFSVSDTKPSGTLEAPPTQAHLSFRLST